MSEIDKSIFEQYVQIHRGQGRDGPFNDHEELVLNKFKEVEQFYIDHNCPDNFKLLTPYLLFAKGWVAALKAVGIKGT